MKESARNSPSATARWAGPVLLVLAGTLLAAWTWGRWCDPIIDFGRELYVPWQLSLGKALHRDIAWFNGPLSPWVNTLLFRLFGPGLDTLVWANLALLVIMTALIHRLVRQLADRLTAAACGLLFLGIFAFGHLHALGNYCFVTPYSHGITHGVILGTAMLLLLHRAGRRRSPRALAGAGLCLGLAFLTKPEIFTAAAAGALTFLLLDRLCRRPPLITVKSIAFLTGAFLLPPLAAWVVLLASLAPGPALLAVLGGWPATLSGKLAALPFYRGYMGFDRPLENLLLLLAWTAGLLLFPLLPAWAAARLASRPDRPARHRLLPWLALPGGALLPALLLPFLPWPMLGRPLPLVMAVAGLWGLVLLWRGRETGPEHITVMAVIAFSLALLLKMILKVRLDLYGFVLAMPAFLTAAALALHALPRRLAARGPAQAVWRNTLLGFLALVLVAHLALTGQHLAPLVHRIGKGRDTFRADRQARVVMDFLALVRKHDRHSRLTLAVLPEGIMLNYLARRPSPVRHINYMPPELLLFGEERILAELRASPPDLVAYVCRPTPEYGFFSFGQGYGEKIDTWIKKNYLNLGEAKLPPLEWNKPGAWILLLRRKE